MLIKRYKIKELLILTFPTHIFREIIIVCPFLENNLLSKVIMPLTENSPVSGKIARLGAHP